MLLTLNYLILTGLGCRASTYGVGGQPMRMLICQSATCPRLLSVASVCTEYSSSNTALHVAGCPAKGFAAGPYQCSVCRLSAASADASLSSPHVGRPRWSLCWPLLDSISSRASRQTRYPTFWLGRWNRRFHYCHTPSARHTRESFSSGSGRYANR